MGLLTLIMNEMEKSRRREEEAGRYSALSNFTQNMGTMTPEQQISALAQIDPSTTMEILKTRLTQKSNTEPYSALAKLYADKQRGLIDEEAFNAAVKKETATNGVQPQSTAAKLYADKMAGLIDDTTFNALLQKEIGQGQAQPQSPLAKLFADRNAGLIDETVFQNAVKKETERPPRQYNQFQQTSAGFADRMANAQNYLSQLESKAVDPVNKTASALSKLPVVGDYLENVSRSEDQQVYWNNAQDWIRAKLRKESGAVIGPKEMSDEFRTYFPMPGDGPDVIANKKMLRDVATNTMIKQSAGAYDELYGTPTEGDKGQKQTDQKQGKQQNKSLKNMTTEQLKALLAKKKGMQ